MAILLVVAAALPGQLVVQAQPDPTPTLARREVKFSVVGRHCLCVICLSSWTFRMRR